MTDLAIMARKLALKHIRGDVERNISEDYLRSTHARSSCGQKFVDNTGGDEFGAYDVGIGGYYDFGPDGRGTKQAPTSKIVVHRVCGQTVNMVFSLHELYLECQKGQLSLL